MHTYILHTPSPLLSSPSLTVLLSPTIHSPILLLPVHLTCSSPIRRVLPTLTPQMSGTLHTPPVTGGVPSGSSVPLEWMQTPRAMLPPTDHWCYCPTQTPCHLHIHTRVHKYVHTDTHTYVHTHMYKHTHKHKRGQHKMIGPHINSGTEVHWFTLSNTRLRSCACMRACVCVCMPVPHTLQQSQRVLHSTRHLDHLLCRGEGLDLPKQGREED